MIDRIFKSENGPGAVEYTLLLIVLVVSGVAIMSFSPRGEGLPMTNKPAATAPKG